MKTITGILILAALTSSLQAQRPCNSTQYRDELVKNNPSIARAFADEERKVEITLKNQRNNSTHRDTAANEWINIPVVVHIVYNAAEQNISDAQVLSQLTALNKDFNDQNTDRVNRPAAFANAAADVRIQFCLARVTPNGQPTSGIVRTKTTTAVFSADDAVKNKMRGGDDAWDSKKYLNVWVCNLGGRTLGYASLPGSQADADGVVIGFDVFGTIGNLRTQFNKGRTLTHEVGHWLGVKHIWGDTECGDDGVEDTPRQRTYNFGCPSFPQVTECSANADGDMFMNFMDFSDDACMNMFTVGQKKRMRALFANGNARNSFLTSSACDSVQAGPVAGDTAVTPVAVKKDAFKLYPNPVSSAVTIEYVPASSFITQPFVVYNLLGVKLMQGQLTREKTTVDVSTLQKGIYIIRIGDAGAAFTQKIQKQ